MLASERVQRDMNLHHTSTMLAKKRYASKAFQLTEAARNVFYLVKDLLNDSAKRENMNSGNPLILNTDASMKAVAKVLKIQDGREQPCVFVSDIILCRPLSGVSWMAPVWVPVCLRILC